MRRVALLGVLALLAGALVLGSRGSAEPDAPASPSLAQLRSEVALEPCPAAVSRELPAEELPCLGGGDPVPVAAGGPGRPTVVNFWAVWCEPCQAETPLLVDLHARAGDRLGVLGVATQSETDLSLYFSRDFRMRYPSLEDDDGTVFRRFGGGLPITLFVDAQGRVRGKEVGEIESRAELDGLVEKHLGVRL